MRLHGEILDFIWHICFEISLYKNCFKLPREEKKIIFRLVNSGIFFVKSMCLFYEQGSLFLL